MSVARVGCLLILLVLGALFCLPYFLQQAQRSVSKTQLHSCPSPPRSYVQVWVPKGFVELMSSFVFLLWAPSIQLCIYRRSLLRVPWKTKKVTEELIIVYSKCPFFYLTKAARPCGISYKDYGLSVMVTWRQEAFPGIYRLIVRTMQLPRWAIPVSYIQQKFNKCPLKTQLFVK